MRSTFTLLSFLLLLVISCTKKEGDSPTPTSILTDCIPIEMTNSQNDIVIGSSTGSQKLYYNASSQITHTEVTGNMVNVGEYKYEYKDDKVIKATVYINGALNYYEEYIYNNSNQIIQKNFHNYVNGQFEPSLVQTFDYAAPLELKKFTYSYNNKPYGYDLYQYTNGLVTTVIHYSPDGTLNGRTEYEYDEKKSIYSSLSSNQLFRGTILFPINIHNVTKRTDTNSSGEINKRTSFTTTYEYNSGEYPVKSITKWLNGSETTNTITYMCK